MEHSTRYGNYKIKKSIGKGGYGEVFLVQEINNKNYYAMKMLDKEKIARENLEDNMLAEVRSMKIVNHPYIVRLFELLKTNRKILLIMEYLDGGDLFDAIKREKKSFIPEDKSRFYFQQIILAVKYLHSKNIIHRDLKPENILIDKVNDCIKITDFGLSALIQHKDEILPDIAGTTDYLAPEVIKQTGYLGQSADIWSCGVILYNMVTGNKPFVGKGSKMIRNIMCSNVNYPTGTISKGLIDLLKKLLEPEPNSRISINKIMEHEWFKFGFEKQKKYVDNYLLLSKDEDNSSFIISKKSIDYIATIYASYKNLTINLDDLPLIDAFNFTMLLYGHNTGKMFSKDKDKKDFNEYYSYKFICKKNLEYFCNVFNDFFEKNEIEKEYIKTEKNKINVNLVYKESHICIGLEIFRLNNDGKVLYIVTLKNGVQSDYKNIMEMFFNKYKNDIQKI